MAQEFTIKSQDIEDKINQLLPSQGGFQPGVDFSASTMVIPIVDLTETAEGSTLRQDLQTSFSLTSITAFDITNTTSTIVNTTGYYRVFGSFNFRNDTGVGVSANLSLTDGLTTRKILQLDTLASLSNDFEHNIFDFIVKLNAGESLTGTTDSTNANIAGNTRQIADISGNLTNPL